MPMIQSPSDEIGGLVPSTARQRPPDIAYPAQVEPDHRFVKLRRLVEVFEIERVTLPILLVTRMLVAGKLDVAAVGRAD